MGKRKSSVQGRGEEIVGKGFDALFNDPAEGEEHEGNPRRADASRRATSADLGEEAEHESRPELKERADELLDTMLEEDEETEAAYDAFEARREGADAPWAEEEEEYDPAWSADQRWDDEAMPDPEDPLDIYLESADKDDDSVEHASTLRTRSPQPPRRPQPSSLVPDTRPFMPEEEETPDQPFSAFPTDRDYVDAPERARPGMPVSSPLSGVSPGEGAGLPTTSREREERHSFDPPVQAPLSDEERQAVLARLDSRRLEALSNDIDRLYDEVTTYISNRRPLAEQALASLREAREILLIRPEYYTDAEYRVQQVQAILQRTLASREWGTRYGRRILLYETVWLVALLGGFIAAHLFEQQINAWILSLMGGAAAAAQAPALLAQVLPFWSTLMWGGIGGVVGAMYSLWWHVSEKQDFDRQYVMWYVVQPIMGLVLGGIVYLMLAAGFLVVNADLTSPDANVGARILPAVIACVAGFRQHFVYELIDRVVEVLSPSRS